VGRPVQPSSALAVADSLAGMRVATDVTVPGEGVTIQAGKKISKNSLEALKRAGVESVQIADAELEGAFAAADIIDPAYFLAQVRDYAVASQVGAAA